MSWRTVIVFLAVVLLFFVALSWSVADVACAATTEQAVYEMLREVRPFAGRNAEQITLDRLLNLH